MVREREREKLHTTRQAAEETVPGVLKHDIGVRGQESSTRPRKSQPTARYKARSAKTAAFSRKTMHRKEKREGALKKRARQQAIRKEKTEFRIQHKDCTAQFKSVGRAARVQCKRSVKNKTRNRSRPQCERHCEAGDDDKRERESQ